MKIYQRNKSSTYYEKCERDRAMKNGMPASKNVKNGYHHNLYKWKDLTLELHFSLISTKTSWFM